MRTLVAIGLGIAFLISIPVAMTETLILRGYVPYTVNVKQSDSRLLISGNAPYPITVKFRKEKSRGPAVASMRNDETHIFMKDQSFNETTLRRNKVKVIEITAI